jgi:hypothetical protein
MIFEASTKKAGGVKEKLLCWPKMRPILDTPAELVTNGRFHLGTFKRPFFKINPLDVRLAVPLPRAVKNLRLKEWQHFGLANPEYYLSLALFNAKTMALAQVCLYRRADRQVIFHERKTAAWSMRLPDTLFDSHAEYESRGFEIKIHNALSAGHYRIEFHVQARKNLPSAHGLFTFEENPGDSEPLIVCLPLGKRTALYSHKFIGPVEGSLILADRVSVFSPADSYGLVDVHKGYYPYVMKWHWATGGGRDAQGRLCGFNLTDNQVKDQESYNENCIWREGRLKLLPPVKFSFDPGDPLRPWTVRDRDGLVDLTFHPEVVRRVDLNALVIRSKYRGPFGAFSGRLRTQEGEEAVVVGFFGMCENFYLRT